MLTVTSGRLPAGAGVKMSPSAGARKTACIKLAWSGYGSHTATRGALAL